MACNAAILAGGDSFRMGCEKAFIELEGKSLIRRTLDTLAPLFPRLMIISNRVGRYDSLGVPVYPDRVPDKGPLGGIYTALSRSADPVFVVACDMPFLNPDLIRYLLDRFKGHDAALFRSPDGSHPLHAVYSPSILPVIEENLLKGHIKITRLLERIDRIEISTDEVRAIDPAGKFLTNLNTPEELAKARGRALN